VRPEDAGGERAIPGRLEIRAVTRINRHRDEGRAGLRREPGHDDGRGAPARRGEHD
jgi:hypothetical protein